MQADAQPRKAAPHDRPELRILPTRDPGDDVLTVVLLGRWRMREGVPSAGPVLAALDRRRPSTVLLDAHQLAGWDSSVLVLVTRIVAACAERGLAVTTVGLPDGARRLLERAARAPEAELPGAEPHPGFVASLGQGALAVSASTGAVVRFVGEYAIAVARLFLGRGSTRRRDVFYQLQMCGARALGIVALVNFLIGMILAFIGSVQLRSYGSELYVADLVAIAMVREMAAVMTAIVVAGQTGAAFAAELGTMRVTEEIDALTTLGIAPMEFLVVPRVLALSFMLPLLTVYADLVAILGGGLVAVGMLGISTSQYVNETIKSLDPSDLLGGVGKALLYGALVAFAGCYHGLRAGSGAAAVGRATTAAVVSGIVLVILAAGILAVVFHVLGV